MTFRKLFCYFLIFTVFIAVISGMSSGERDSGVDEPVEEETVVDKRIPHPYWRSNVRINHISHQNADAPYLRFYDDGFFKPSFIRWARRPYAFSGNY